MSQVVSLEKLILFLEKEHPYDFGFNSQTKLRACNIDGVDAVDLFEKLMDEFAVTFENFDYHQYFLEEKELAQFNWFGFKKDREIEEELTVQMLFDYMQANQCR